MSIKTKMITSCEPKKQSLNEFPCGREGILRTLSATTNPEIIRLLEMGMTDGSRVKILRRSLLGGLLHIMVCGTQLCLRKKEAALFFVQSID
jgi:Fe2+ transport system protein FeoA